MAKDLLLTLDALGPLQTSAAYTPKMRQWIFISVLFPYFMYAINRNIATSNDGMAKKQRNGMQERLSSEWCLLITNARIILGYFILVSSTLICELVIAGSTTRAKRKRWRFRYSLQQSISTCFYDVPYLRARHATRLCWPNP